MRKMVLTTACALAVGFGLSAAAIAKKGGSGHHGGHHGGHHVGHHVGHHRHHGMHAGHHHGHHRHRVRWYSGLDCYDYFYVRGVRYCWLDD